MSKCSFYEKKNIDNNSGEIHSSQQQREIPSCVIKYCTNNDASGELFHKNQVIVAHSMSQNLTCNGDIKDCPLSKKPEY